ncbi:transcriptional regulator, AraC family [Pseudoxanthomonas sp. GM95]|uniref:AraC family transcriptional regulator n=1 Tax=Pseudoxanthomonas sp. GM95 TaxID=1881043 RepID=UPI0008D1C52C|nr:AraC family transcriptional regulator [Pseudoxanthomonas sp. GM95]SEL52128.1 transcriptional regulator, AraC family [Pseudoxanthomonas sp. GM95]
MTDPLTDVVTLLQPRASLSKLVSASGAWRVTRTEVGRPFYCVVLEGACALSVEGGSPLALEAGDFILIPAANHFSMSSVDPVPMEDTDPATFIVRDGHVRVGDPQQPLSVQSLLGYCAFDSPDAALLVSLLPRLLHVRGQPRLATLVQLVREESRAARPAREVILSRLLEVLLIEALRATTGTEASSGLLNGLADERLAQAIRAMHAHPTQPWTVAQLAGEAALSRSAFFERFNRTVGVPPMEYLLAWRMALAKDLLRRREGSVAQVAERVGYSSASTFSVAFARHVGRPPMRYAREQETVEA